MSRTHYSYMLFSFEWTKKYDAYEYAFNCKTGQIAEDHGELDGSEEDFRYVVAVAALNRTATIEWDAAGNDVFANDLDAIGKVLQSQAEWRVTELLRGEPESGEAIFVWKYSGGVTDSTPDGPGEGWSETEFLGEFGQVLSKLDK